MMQKQIADRIEKIDTWLAKKEKLFAVLCVLALICLMIPFYWFGRYTAPLADDFNTVTGTHHAWITSHSIWQVILAAVEKTKGYYIGWTGAFTNVFLQCLMPGLGDYRTYFIASWIILTTFLIANFYFGKCLIVDVMGQEKTKWLIITVITTVIQIECLPVVYDAFFWFVGAEAYVFAYSLKLILAGIIIKELASDRKVRPGMLILNMIYAFLIGGTEFGPTSVLLICVLGCLVIFSIVRKRKICYTLIVSASFALAWILTVAAPGNSVRQSMVGEKRGVIFSIVQALTVGAMRIYEWINPFMLIVPLLALPFIILCVKKVKFEFPLPMLVSLLSYGIYSSMYAPMIYANYGAVGQVNGYTNNVIYLIFILLWMGNIIYWTGWMTKHYASRKKQSISCYYVSVLCGIFLITCVAHIPGDYCSFTLLHWVRTGTMQANMEKYLEREEILRNSPGEDVVVEAISFPEGIYTSGAGEITSDTEHWINIGVSDYYGVKSVRTE